MKKENIQLILKIVKKDKFWIYKTIHMWEKNMENLKHFIDVRLLYKSL